MTKLFRVPISSTSKSQALALIGDWLRKRRLLTIKLITTPNPEMIVAAQTDPEFLKALQSADLAIPDGIGIVWALRLLKKSIKTETMDDRKWKVGAEGRKSKIENSNPTSIFNLPPPSSTFNHLPSTEISRLSGLDLMESLIREPQKVGPFELKVMLVGGRPGVAQKAADNLRHQIRPGLASQGQAFIKSISGPQNLAAASPDELDGLINSINSFQPDLLFVAFGHGKQEKWLTKNRHRLNAGVAMGIGGALDQIADPSLRPPAYINSIGLGWLYRLFREPRRWKRQLALVKFVGMVLRDRILEGRR